MKGNYQRVRSLVICAMLTAMSVLLTRFCSPQIGDAMRFSFGTIPIMLAGMLFGPAYGFTVGVLADLLGCVVNLMGSGFIITLTVCSGLMGLVSGVIFRYVMPALLRKKETNAAFVATVVVSAIVTEVAVSAFLKSACLLQLYGGTYMTWFVQKIITAGVMSAVEIIVLIPLLKAAEKILKKDRS